jgi:hypothetical protein
VLKINEMLPGVVITQEMAHGLKAFERGFDHRTDLYEGDKEKDEKQVDKLFTVDHVFNVKFGINSAPLIQTPEEFKERVGREWYLSRESPLIFLNKDAPSWEDLYFPFLHCT